MSRVSQCTTPDGVLKIRVADRFISRALGLLGGAPLDPAVGLLISPCSSIHTLGMRYSIDVVFMDREAQVLRVCANVRSGRIRFVFGARAVLELRSGVAARHGIKPGTRLVELTPALR